MALESEKPIVSLIVPCYNEAGNVFPFHDAAVKAFSGSDFSVEIVYVDDGSKDATLSEMKALLPRAACPVQLVRFSRNFGKEAAILAGLRHATGEFLCLIDGDLQQPPAVARRMAELLLAEPDTDCIAAVRENRQESLLKRRLTAAFYRLIDKVSDVHFEEDASDFRMMRRNVAEALLSLSETHRFSKGLFAWVGFETKYIPYTAEARTNGATKWSPAGLFRYAWEGILSFSTAPMRIAVYCGTASSVCAFLYLLVVIVQKFAFGISVPGYATLVCLVLLLGGMILFFLGLLGEYISRIFIQVKGRPSYIVKEHLSGGDAAKREAPPLDAKNCAAAEHKADAVIPSAKSPASASPTESSSADHSSFPAPEEPA